MTDIASPASDVLVLPHIASTLGLREGDAAGALAHLMSCPRYLHPVGLTGPPGALCTPSAQHAVRQAKVLGDNIVRVLNGRTPSAYVHKHVGSVASLGLHKGVAQVYGFKLRGFPAWFMHRTYHVSRVPTLNRKVRVVLDWTLALCFRRDVVSLGSLQRPREKFSEAAR